VQAHIQSFLDYLQYEKRYSPHTLLSYQNDLEQFADYALKQYERDDIVHTSHIEIRSWIVSMMEQKITARSINRKISALKSFFKYMMRKGEISKSPLAKVLNPKTGKRLPVFVEKAGIEKLLHDIEFPEGFEGVRDKMVIELLYGTGMRRSELINLKETDIDSWNSQVKVLGKGNKERIIPLHPDLKDSLANYLNEKKKAFESAANAVLVGDKGKKMQPGEVYSIVKKYLNEVTTIDKRSPHVLRHTFATHLMNNGADINAVKELLGHSSLAATQVYTHNTIDKLKEIYKQAHPKG
jgi:integrase/recombinase XerC